MSDIPSEERGIGIGLAEGNPQVLELITPFLIERVTRLRLSTYGLDPSEIEDVVAESLYKVWKHRETFRPELGQLGPWCDAILRNTAIDLSRQKQRQLPSRTPLPDELAEPPTGTNLSDEEASAHHLLADLLATLSDTDRCILNAHAADPGGRWAANVAPTLGMKPGAVRVRRLRLIQRLRTELIARNYPLSSIPEIINESI